MLIMLMLALLLQGGGGVVTLGQTPAAAAGAADIPAAEPEPDAITRGRSTVVVVRGSSLEALKTLTVEPATGLRLGTIEPLPARPDGSQAVRVTITVDGAAEPGDRDLILTVAPTISSAPQPGNSSDDAAARIEEARRMIIAHATRPTALGTIHINSHDVTITRASFVRSGSHVTGTVVIDDARGDIGERAMPPMTVSGGGGLTLVPVTDPLTIEARCGGGDVIDLLGDDVKVQGGQGPSITVTTTIEADELAGRPDCELRVRAEDAEGNMSAWSQARPLVQGKD